MSKLETHYSPKTFEDNIYKFWQDNKFFEPNMQSDQKPFVMVIPPPNVTGVLHMGHGLNNSLQDILARYYRMQGRPTLWLPGTDHAGIATQHVVERKLKEEGKTKHDLGREEFLKKTWQVKEEHQAIIINQLKKIGSSCDWSRERFTLDDGLSTAVRETFVSLYERGLIYQGLYLVNWCSTCGTAIADDEVEYEEKDDFLYYVQYPFSDGSGHLVVATSRPETFFGDSAVAVHPDDDRYKNLHGKELRVPLTNRTIKVITDSYVDMAFGSACLKVTPSHDANDYELGKKHNLEFINILTEDGKLNKNVPSDFVGLSVKEARKLAISQLEAEGLLVKKDPLRHRIGLCYRCNTVIEPYMSKQWFVKMTPLAEKALKALEDGDINFYPKRWENTYTHWMKNIRDWCISRQLWWGHRIPAWYCKDCSEINVSRTDITTCKCGSTNIKQDDDVLDTWFSSWLWPFSTLGWPDKTVDLAKFFPTSTLVTAYDIIFFWVARMVMASLEFTGKVPFKDIYITPLVRDKQGRKMSKSLGNGIDPLEIVNEHGADALKFTIAYLSSQGQDLPLDKESFKFGANFCNKVWNASRYLMMNLEGRTLINNPTLNNLDIWIYDRLNLAIASMNKAVSEYRFDDMAHVVYDYFWKDFCDWYIEGSKIYLYSDDENEKNRALSVALNILEESLRLMHPFIPFITEEIFLKLPNKSANSIMVAPYPKLNAKRDNDLINSAFSVLTDLVGSVRTLRSSSNISMEKKVRLAILLDVSEEIGAIIKEQNVLISTLVKASELSFITNKADADGAVSAMGNGFTAFVFARDLVNIDDEKAKTEKELVKMQALKDGALAKLNNENFLSRANDLAIAKEKGKLAEAESALAKLSDYLQTLK